MDKRCWIIALSLLICCPVYADEHEIAITIDDLPFVGSSHYDPVTHDHSSNQFDKILQALIQYNVPATGFIIAGSIGKNQWPLLEAFRDAGFALGNHTYSHQSLGLTRTEKYLADLEKAEKILAPIMSSPKYFRYPYLSEGKGQKRKEIYKYLADHEYTIARVTIDSKDFRFNKQIYSTSYRLREQKLEQIKKKYLAFIWKETLKAQAEARRNNAPDRQILLLHANLLNSYFLGDVLELFRSNGYRMISLEEAIRPGRAAAVRTKTTRQPERRMESEQNISFNYEAW